MSFVFFQLVAIIYSECPSQLQNNLQQHQQQRIRRKTRKTRSKSFYIFEWVSFFVCSNIWIFTIFRTKLITCKLGIILMQGNSLPFFQRIGSIFSKYRHKENECFSCISNCNEKVTFSKTLCSRSQFCNKFLHGFFPSLLNFHCFSCSNFRRNKQSKNTIYKKEKKTWIKTIDNF